MKGEHLPVDRSVDAGLRVSVIVINWNGAGYLEECLNGLKAQTRPPHEVIVVDNASRDVSVAWLKSQSWPPLKTLFLDENRGFSGGNNAGFALVTGDIVALLNNDAVAHPDWIAKGVQPFAEPRVGMVACKALRAAEPSTIDKAGHLIYPDGLNRGRGTGQADTSRFNVVQEGLWPDGSAGFYRKSMLDEIGFLDDDFFLYGEDAELGMRAQWAGFTCVYQPLSFVWHRHSGSLGKFSSKKVYFVERNRIFLLVKTFPWTWILRSPAYSLARYVMNLASVVKGVGSASGFRREHSTASLAGVFFKSSLHGMLGIPKMWRKRRGLVRRRTNSEMVRVMRRHRIGLRELTWID